MNVRLARLLTRLYPRAWRQRYGKEFQAFLEAERAGLRGSWNVVWSALCEHMMPTQRGDMAQSSRASVSLLVRSSALGCIRSRAAPAFGWRLLHRLSVSVVCLDHLSAGSRYTLRRSFIGCAIWLRESLFSIRQVLLFRRADSRRLGNRICRRPSKNEGNLAHRRSAPGRTDGWHRRDSRESQSGPRRARTYPHGLLRLWTLSTGLLRGLRSCLGDPLAHGVALAHLAAITKIPLQPALLTPPIAGIARKNLPYLPTQFATLKIEINFSHSAQIKKATVLVPFPDLQLGNATAMVAFCICGVWPTR